MSRLYGIAESTQTSSGKKVFKEKLLEIISKKEPGTFNQAIMEFGALQCVPNNPNCQNCLFIKSCFAYNNDMIRDLPLKKPKINQKDRYFNYLLITHGNATFVEQRMKNDIWKLLYQFPLIETTKKISLVEIMKDKKWKSLFGSIEPEIDLKVFEKKHILSHQKIHAQLFKLKINKPNEYILNNYKMVQIDELHTLGVPRLLEIFIKQIIN